MDYYWIAVAFGCGFALKQINLPPLIGYLIAGFALHAFGVVPDTSLETLADLGVSLLLFTIGLKLNLKSLLKPEIWASAFGHMGIIVLFTMLNSLFLMYLGVIYFENLDWPAAMLIGFAVSFSSTVCAVKVLEDRGEMRAKHAEVAVGILIIQDVAAVMFVTMTSEIHPSWWALGLLALPLIKPLLGKLLQYSGHGEVLPLAGFFMALSGGELFHLVGLEAHLGALIVGILLSGQVKAIELAKSLLGFKDLFLIGFFLSIGFTATPTVDMFVIALLFTIALPFKSGLFFLLLTRLNLPSRTAFLSALSLANYSEFGLIVCSISLSHGLLPKEWLIILAISVGISFIFSSIINLNAHPIYQHWKEKLKYFESPQCKTKDQFTLPQNVSILVVGMGRVGRGTYDELHHELQKSVCGVDVDRNRVKLQSKQGRKVICADAEDPDFWAHVSLHPVQLIMFALPIHQDILEAIKQLSLVGYQGKTAAVARYQDEESELKSAGVDVVFNYYSEVGTGFAEQTIHLLDNYQVSV